MAEATNGVSMKPGATAFTAMPFGPSSRAHAFIIVSTAPLLVA
jgi:hypothetical protein